MKPQELVRTVINKKLVPVQKGRGRRGYGNLLRVRILVYQRLKRIDSDKQLIRHLKMNPKACYGLGFYQGIPDRSQLSRWKAKYSNLLREVFEKLARLYGKAELLVVDSMPIEDYRDPEAKVGFYSKGFFKGFKVHCSVNQLGLPIKAVITPGNRHDSQLFNQLLVKAEKVLGDSGYDSAANRKLCKQQGSKPLIARNPRRSGKSYEAPWLLKRKRYLVEQFNSLLKETLNNCWKLVKGLKRKASLVYATLASIHSVWLEQAVRKVSTYWY